MFQIGLIELVISKKWFSKSIRKVTKRLRGKSGEEKGRQRERERGRERKLKWKMRQIEFAFYLMLYCITFPGSDFMYLICFFLINSFLFQTLFIFTVIFFVSFFFSTGTFFA